MAHMQNSRGTVRLNSLWGRGGQEAGKGFGRVKILEISLNNSFKVVQRIIFTK
jgi:hypothetical protein